MVKTKIGVLTILIILNITTHAQESLNGAGGDANGGNGKVSYSIGQTVYSAYSDSSGSAAQGVQQPYEITVTLDAANIDINLEMNIYPNPTIKDLNLIIEGHSNNFSFEIYDLNGEILKSQNIKTDNTVIKMEGLANAVYFLNIKQNNETVKIFKVIKTN
jgi:hypothetical protein